MITLSRIISEIELRHLFDVLVILRGYRTQYTVQTFRGFTIVAVSSATNTYTEGIGKFQVSDNTNITLALTTKLFTNNIILDEFFLRKSWFNQTCRFRLRGVANVVWCSAGDQRRMSQRTEPLDLNNWMPKQKTKPVAGLDDSLIMTHAAFQHILLATADITFVFFERFVCSWTNMAQRVDLDSVGTEWVRRPFIPRRRSPSPGELQTAMWDA